MTKDILLLVVVSLCSINAISREDVDTFILDNLLDTPKNPAILLEFKEIVEKYKKTNGDMNKAYDGWLWMIETLHFTQLPLPEPEPALYKPPLELPKEACPKRYAPPLEELKAVILKKTSTPPKKTTTPIEPSLPKQIEAEILKRRISIGDDEDEDEEPDIPFEKWN